MSSWVGYDMMHFAVGILGLLGRSWKEYRLFSIFSDERFGSTFILGLTKRKENADPLARLASVLLLVASSYSSVT